MKTASLQGGGQYPLNIFLAMILKGKSEGGSSSWALGIVEYTLPWHYIQIHSNSEFYEQLGSHGKFI